MRPSTISIEARPPPTCARWSSIQDILMSPSVSRDDPRSGRIPTWSARSAVRAARFAERTEANVAIARTSVPPAVARAETVAQSAIAAGYAALVPGGDRSRGGAPADAAGVGRRIQRARRPGAPPQGGPVSGGDDGGGPTGRRGLSLLVAGSPTGFAFRDRSHGRGGVEPAGFAALDDVPPEHASHAGGAGLVLPSDQVRRVASDRLVVEDEPVDLAFVGIDDPDPPGLDAPGTGPLRIVLRRDLPREVVAFLARELGALGLGGALGVGAEAPHYPGADLVPPAARRRDVVPVPGLVRVGLPSLAHRVLLGRSREPYPSPNPT